MRRIRNPISIQKHRLHVHLRRRFAQALVDHGMIENNDHVLIGLSGGKDSWALLGLLADLAPRAPVRFRLSAVTIDGGFVGLNKEDLRRGCEDRNIPFHYRAQRIFETVAEKKDEGSRFCSMCSKLRRGALYQIAHEVGATKIALGHHLDDALETLFLNLFYGGRMAALPPVLLSNAGHATIIRPLLYCEESELHDYVREQGYPVVGCICPICPTHPEYEGGELKRKRIKEFLRRTALDHPHFHSHIRKALQRLEPNRFLDPKFSEKILSRDSLDSPLL